MNSSYITLRSVLLAKLENSFKNYVSATKITFFFTNCLIAYMLDVGSLYVSPPKHSGKLEIAFMKHSSPNY